MPTASGDRHPQRGEVSAVLWRLRWPFMFAGLLSLAINLLALTPTIYLLQIYDRVLASQSELSLLAISLLALGCFLLMAAAEGWRTRVLVQAGRALDHGLGPRVFQAGLAQQAGLQAAEAQPPLDDLTQLRQFLTGAGILALFDAPWTPLYLGVLFMLHPALGALGVVFVLVQIALVGLGQRRTVAPALAATAAAAQAARFLDGKLRNAHLIEALGMVSALQRRWSQHRVVAGRLSTRAQHLAQRATAWSKFFRYSQQSLSLAAGALLVIRGELSPGAMIAANLLMTRTLAPIDQFAGGWRGFVAAHDAWMRLEALLQQAPRPSAQLNAGHRLLPLTLSGVAARLPGRAQPSLQAIDLHVAPGQVLVVQGPSGSGKSTLARLLVGVWPAAAGEVRWAGLPRAAWNDAELGQQIGYLPQDVDLLDGSIAENIARHGEVDSEQVIEAARAAGLHELILKFPKGYDTPVGEDGEALSGGLRQRVGLARALFGNPTLVVLDEPDAHLDEFGEAALRQAVLAMRARGCAVVLISHHPALLAVADRVLLLSDGRVESNAPP